MKKSAKFVSLLALAAVTISIFTLMKDSRNGISSEGYIGKSDITITDGVMTPEALLAFGRLSDPQVSPDGEYIMYGVSYTSVEENRSVRNLFICNIDGSAIFRVNSTLSGRRESVYSPSTR